MPIEPAAWIRQFLRREGRPQTPDARPLYAYRTTAEEFEDLQAAVCATVERENHRLPPDCGQLFCLFAAEWWRRHHQGGAWKWEGILDACGLGGVALSSLYPALDAGLRRWRRPLLRDARGRIFLVTLACEGGLPLRVIHQQGNALNRYFKHLLQEFQLFYYPGVSSVELAARGAADLPRSLRQEVVLELSGRLIQEIWGLRELLRDKVGETATPVRDLDRLQPDWRKALPLELEDQTARALLNNLVEEAAKLRPERPARLRLVRGLVETDGMWRLSAKLELPPRLTPNQWSALLELPANALPTRSEFHLQCPVGMRITLGLVTEVTSRGETFYRLERSAPSEISVRDAAAAEVYGLHAGSGAQSRGLGLPGGAELGELPWFFTPEPGEQTANRSYRLRGQGSVSTRHAYGLAVVGPQWQALAGTGKLVRRGLLDQLDRTVYEVAGTVAFRDEEGLECRIRTAQQSDDAAEYRLRGPTEPWGEAGTEIFRGLPKLFALGSDDQGAGREVSAAALEWRPRSEQAQWLPLADDCLGSVQLRWVEAGALRFQTNIEILPAEFEIELEPGADHRRGSLTLAGLRGAEVGVDGPGAELTVERKVSSQAMRLDLTAEREPPSAVRLLLRWDRRRKMIVELPFPGRGARFVGRRGELLAIDEQVPLARLAGLRAGAVSIDPDERFLVDCCLVTPHLDPVVGAVFAEDLRPAADGRRHDLDLGALSEPLRRLFAESENLDAEILLRIESSVGGRLRPRPLRVRRFDLFFRPERETGDVVLEGLTPGDEAEGEGLRIEARPLWDPEAEPVPLPPAAEASRWSFEPAQRAPGPWLIFGWDGDWCRVRPLLWTVAPTAIDHSGLTALQRAVCTDSKERAAALSNVVRSLAAEPLAADWELVFAYLRLLARLPAATLALPTRLVKDSQAAALALVRAPGEDVALFWNLLEELPFSWQLVSLTAWTRAVEVYHQALCQELRALGNAREIADQQIESFLDRALDHREFFRPIAAWIRVRTLDRTPDGDDLRTDSQILEDLKEEVQELHRRNQGRWWPQGDLPQRWLREHAAASPPAMAPLWQLADDFSSYCRPTLLAPIAAALACAYDLPTDRTMVYELRRWWNFDPRWFDRAYEYALWWALWNRPEN